MFQNLHIIVVLWGKPYVDLFLDLSLPSQLAPGNIPALQCLPGVKYKIYTTHADEEVIRAHPSFHRLSQLVPVQIKSVHSFDEFGFVSDIVNDGKFSILMKFCNMAIADADLENAAVTFLTPDFIMADNTFSRMLEICRTGYRTILILTLRLFKETSMPDFLDNFYNPETGVLQAAPRDLVRVGYKHLHFIERGYIWGPGMSGFPIHAYWPVQNDGLIAHCYYLHPLVIFPRQRGFMPVLTIDVDYVDRVCPDPKDIYIVRDSDELVGFELTTYKLCDLNAAGKTLPATYRDYARWALIHCTPYHRSNLHHWYFQNAIRIHSGDYSPAWQSVQKQSNKASKWIRRYSLWQKKISNLADFVSFYSMTKHKNP